jgi:signal transduction histidine kinase
MAKTVRDDSRVSRTRQAVGAFIVLGLAGSFTVLAVVHARSAAVERAYGEFRVQAAERTGLLRLETIRRVASIESFGRFIQLRPESVAADFVPLSRGVMAQFPGLYSVAWSEWVSGPDRRSIAESLRHEGFDVADIYARGEAERRMDAPEADHHLVVRRMYPDSLAPRGVGYDVMSQPHRREVTLRAMEQRAAAATGPVRLGADPSGMYGVIIFVPVYDRGNGDSPFIGTISIGFRIKPSLETWLEEHASPLVRTVIYDRDESGAWQVLFQRGFDEIPEAEEIEELRADPLAYAGSIDFAGREWRVLSVPSPDYETLAGATAAPAMILGFGLAISLLLAVMAALSVRSYDLARSLAHERKQAATRLSRANEDLRAANEDMEHFLSAMAHDIRNPLLAIRAATAVARSQPTVGAPPTGPLGTIEHAALAMEHIVDGLVEHARAGYAPFRGERVDLDALVRSIAADHEHEADRSGACIQVRGTLPVAFGDRVRLAAAFDNLIGNALKHGRPTSDGQPLHVLVGCATPNERQTDDSDIASHWALFVRDNGPGVPEQQRTAIFKAFQRSALAEGGVGLGLATVQRTAAAHGGRAWVTASPGGGATFWLTIPCLGENPPRQGGEGRTGLSESPAGFDPAVIRSRSAHPRRRNRPGDEAGRDTS